MVAPTFAEQHSTEGTPWERFTRIRREKGLMVGGVAKLAGLTRMQIWAMLTGVYGNPTTPAKKAALIRALNEGPGEPVTESDIWPTEQPAATEAAG